MQGLRGIPYRIHQDMGSLLHDSGQTCGTPAGAPHDATKNNHVRSQHRRPTDTIPSSDCGSFERLVLKEGVRRFVIKFWALWESMIHQEIGRPETDTSQWKKNLSAQPRSGRCRGACEERPSQAIDASLSRRSFFVRRGATCYSSHFPSLLVEVLKSST